MISKNDLKFLKSLQLKKFRDEEKEFIAEGKNNVEEGIKSHYKCNLVIYTENFIKNNRYILNLAEEKNIRTEVLGENEFSKIADSVHPQGILAVFDIPEKQKPDFGKIHFPAIYLDEISDPGNTGTIIRTCDWFGFRNIILSKNSADLYNSKTVRSSAGSLFHLNFYPGINIDEISVDAKKAGFTILASDTAGENIQDFKWTKKLIIAFSNEASGISFNLKNVLDVKISIQGFGKAESLNVASAAAVILSQARFALK